MQRARRARTLFLNHTTVAGGAELALVRILQARPDWNAVVLLARPGEPGLGAFADVPERIAVLVGGVTQQYGAGSAGLSAQAIHAARLVMQAVATRMHLAFRTADLVVANSTRAAAYGALAARVSRTPFVVHIRDLAEAESLGRIGAAIMRRVVLPRADGVIADTESALGTATPFLRAGTPASVIPSASGLTRANTSERATGPVVVGMLARVDPWKGQELLLEAFARAFPRGQERLELAGGWPFGHDEFAARLRRRAEELGVADRVSLLGHVDDVPALLARWDVAVQASLRAEPLGQNVLQYLAAGCATVVADEGGPAEWVLDRVNGRRFAPRDADALAAALSELAGDPDQRRRFGEAGRNTDGLRSDIDIAREHAEFYEIVMSRGRG